MSVWRGHNCTVGSNFSCKQLLFYGHSNPRRNRIWSLLQGDPPLVHVFENASTPVAYFSCRIGMMKDQDTEQMCHFWCTLTLQPPMNNCELYLTDAVTLYPVQEPVEVSQLDFCLLPQNLDSVDGCQTKVFPVSVWIHHCG